MCGRIVWRFDQVLGQWIKEWDPQPEPEVWQVVEKRRYNVPPASHLPILAQVEGHTRAVIGRWGFPLPQRPNGVFNTRIEGAQESPMWSSMLGSSHAVIPVTGFYEWMRMDGKRTVPHFIHRTDGRPMALACLTGLRRIEAEPRRCFSIVTCEPNDLMASLHDRMPVILEQEDVASWLDADQEAARGLAQPAGDVLEAYAVGVQVNSTANDAPELMQPASTSQASLF